MAFLYLQKWLDPVDQTDINSSLFLVPSAYLFLSEMGFTAYALKVWTQLVWFNYLIELIHNWIFIMNPKACLAFITKITIITYKNDNNYNNHYFTWRLRLIQKAITCEKTPSGLSMIDIIVRYLFCFFLLVIMFLGGFLIKNTVMVTGFHLEYGFYFLRSSVRKG